MKNEDVELLNQNVLDYGFNEATSTLLEQLINHVKGGGNKREMAAIVCQLREQMVPQKLLASICGVTISTICRWQKVNGTGSNVPSGLRKRRARTLECKPRIDILEVSPSPAKNLSVPKFNVKVGFNKFTFHLVFSKEVN